MKSFVELTPNIPSVDEIVGYIRAQNKPTTSDLLDDADRRGRFLVQPRSGVGGHPEMVELLKGIDQLAQPDVLTITVDAYTRLLQLDTAAQVLREGPHRLNGYPVVAHGYGKVRDLNERFERPIQIRHGSPDGRPLFAVSFAGGITSYEGGGIGYNLPYCKKVPLAVSLAAWRDIDEYVGHLFKDFGISVEREFFGTLSAVLVPPAVSLSILFLEAKLATSAGCPVLTLAYPQSGNLVQDIAALRTIRRLGDAYLPAETKVYPTLHQFMGVFPADRQKAESIIFLGGLTARLGRATKVITKTYQEAIGVPDVQANIAGIKQTRITLSDYFSSLQVDESLVEEEMYWLERETRELIDDVMERDDLPQSIMDRFSKGLLDIPFPSNSEAKGEVIPIRDDNGAIRFANFGRLPFSAQVKERNNRMVGASEIRFLHKKVRDGIMFFA